MRALVVCGQGGQTAGQAPLDNGQLPHGGYKGSKRHPLSILSFHKGAEFKQSIGQEVDRLLREEQATPRETSPSWAILLHRSPSHTDESPLLANNLLAVSKLGQTAETKLFNQNSQYSDHCCKPLRDIGRLYYRPNSTHQFLSTTDLKDCAEVQVNINYGRPTRTSLLRALQRRNSAGANSYHTRRDFLHRLHDLRNSNQANPFTEIFKSGKSTEGEAFHSFLTGARYNRYNPALGCCFTEVKGRDCHADENPVLTTRIPKQRTTGTYRFRPSTTPGHGNRHSESWDPTLAVSYAKTTPLKLKVIGNNPSVNKTNGPGIKLPHLQTSLSSPGKHSRCPRKDSFGMHSSRSNSAKADSDIQDMSDSIKNAIITSNQEADPRCLEAVEEDELGAADLERIQADERDGNVLENLLTGSTESLSSVSLLVISLPGDKSSSPGLDDVHQADKASSPRPDEAGEEKGMNLVVHEGYVQENNPDRRKVNGFKRKSITENQLDPDFNYDKNDGFYQEGVDGSFLNDDVAGDRAGTNITKSNGQSVNNTLINSDKNTATTVDHENNDALTDNKQINEGVSECSEDVGEVIQEGGGDCSSQAEDREEDAQSPVLPEDDEEDARSPVLPEDREEDARSPVLPEDDEEDARSPVLPEDHEEDARSPVLPEDDEEDARCPVLPEDDEEDARSPVLPEDHEEDARSPVLPEDHEEDARSPVLPEDHEEDARSPVLPEDHEEDARSPVLPEDDEEDARSPVLPEEDEEDARSPVLPEDREYDARSPGLPEDEAVIFFITEENVKQGENAEASDLIS